MNRRRSAQRSRTPMTLPESLERRLSTYALAATGVGLVLLGGAQPLKADSIAVVKTAQMLMGTGSLSFALGNDVFTYGWAEIDLFAAQSQPGKIFDLELLEYAYNRRPNAPILAGQTENHAIPEPNTLALLAFGAAGLPLWRKKRIRKQGSGPAEAHND